MTDEKELLKVKEVERMTRLSARTIYRHMKDGKFPKPIKVGDRAVAWYRHRITEYLDKRDEPSYSPNQ